jgi:Mn-dependent DtxR family transcriptional regulator
MLTERVEDYLEAIYGIRMSKGYVRVKYVATAEPGRCPGRLLH